jgi:hypothetical protein
VSSDHEGYFSRKKNAAQENMCTEARQRPRRTRSRVHAFAVRLFLSYKNPPPPPPPQNSPIPPPGSARASEPSPVDSFRSGGIAGSYRRSPRSGISAPRRPLPDFYTCHLPQAASRRIACSTGYITTKPASTTRRIRVVVGRRSPLRRSNSFCDYSGCSSLYFI